MTNISRKPQTFKILSIDGGGINGLYSARVLENFEKRFRCQLADYFDLICGTSTGGIIGLAISLGLPASLVVSMYRKSGSLVFPRKNRYLAFLKQILWKSKHSNDRLREELEKIFQERLIEESKTLLCIPSFSLNDGRPLIFKFDHPEGNLNRDDRTKYVEVALATSAAPTYLPIVNISNYDNRQFVDGGVYANNPSMVGIVEALKYFVGDDKQFQKLRVLSVASIETPPGRLTIKKGNRSFVDWGQDLFSVFSEGQSYSTEYMVNTLAVHGGLPFEYVRIPSPVLSTEQLSVIGMDNTSERTLELLMQKGADQGDIWGVRQEVIDFFGERKIYQTQS